MKMTEKEMILAEIERLKEWQPIAAPSLDKLTSYINSLPEQIGEIPPKFPLISPKDSNIGENGKNLQESTSEDLEKEIIKVWRDSEDNGNLFELGKLRIIARHFAEWQREQMMKDAVVCNIEGTVYSTDGDFGLARIKGKYKYNDKVKLIII